LHSLTYSSIFLLHIHKLLPLLYSFSFFKTYMLDKNLDLKISDFGLAKLDEEENTHISTRVAGTL